MGLILLSARLLVPFSHDYFRLQVVPQRGWFTLKGCKGFFWKCLSESMTSAPRKLQQDTNRCLDKCRLMSECLESIRS